MAASSVVDVVKNAERLAAFFTADRTQEEHLETVRQFLEPFSKENRYRIINCKLERYNGRTVVHLAASAGHHLSLRELLKRGGDPNRESSAADLKQTPLHISARSRRPKCFQVLLQHGALIDHPNQNKETPRQLAKGLPGIDNVIKAYFAKYEEPKRSPEDLQVIEELHMLAEEESPEALDRFIDLFVSLKPFMQDLSTRFTDFEQTTLVCRICNHLNQPLLNKLMEFTQSPELLHNLSDNKNPLHIVTECGSTEMAEMLIARWPDLVFQTVPPLLTPFHLACYTQTKEMVDVFLRGIALILADYNEEVPLDLNVIDGAGHTPLHHACYNRDCGPIVDALLSFKPEHSNFVNFDVNAVSVTKHRSVLHIAVSREKSNFLLDRLLKEKGINIRLKACPSSSTVKTVTSYWYELAERKGKALSPALQDTGEDRPPTVGSLTTPTRFSPIADVVSGSPEEDEVRELRADVPERGLPVSRSQTVVAEISASTRKVKLRKRSKTEEEGGGKGEFSVNPSLYCSPHGGLEIHASGTEPVEYTPFNQLRMTSLTEACLVGNRTAVEKLLCAGAKANKSTIELLQALEQWDMLQFVLSYHTKMVDYSKQNEMKDNHLQLASKGLKLLWSSLHLTELVGEWFVDGCSYRPLVEKKEGREITICSYPNLPPVVLSDTITEVDIPDNALERIPIELLQLPHLRHLNLSRNSLESLPVAAHRTTLEGVGWRCKELTSLLLSGNKFQELPQVLWKMPRLKELLAANNALRTLGIIHQSEQSEMSQSLEKVDLSENCLDYVSDFLFLLDSVKNVNLSTNSLHSLPEVVWDCVSLEVLDVSKNKLRELPLCETDQSMMTSPLDNYSTNHSPVTMPRSKAQGYHHTGAYLEVSVSLRSTFKRRTQTFLKTEAPKSREGIQDSVKVQADDPSKLRVLKLSHNELSHFPCALPCLAPHLQELDVSFNGSLVEIDIAYLPSRLKELTATNCGIERFGNILPPNVRSYVKRTCRIPDQFGPGKNCIHRSHEQLEYLQKLYLNNNKMEKLPLMRRRPTKLESSLRSSLTANEWHAPEEEITNRDPDEVASGDTKRDDLLFPNVHTVIVSNNRLVGCLNPNVGFLANLHTLSVSNNEALTHLPKELAYLKKQGRGMKLNSLIFADLPNLKDPPPQYQGKPLNHLMSYFRSALKKSVCNRTIKLMVVGSERRGKSTLLRRLRRLQNDPTIERTVGIDIHDWIYPDRTGMFRNFTWKVEKVTFLTWDFGGQEHYYVTHQCFYSKRSLYLVVFRLEDGEAGVHELDSWLREIQTRAPGSPVIIVGTHLDKVTKERADGLLTMAMNLYSSKELYPAVVDSCAISATKTGILQNNGLEDLRSLIYSVACHLFVANRDDTLTYNKNKNPRDSSALFEQKIPACYLELQTAIREVVAEYNKDEKAPILSEEEFRDKFRSVIEEIEEMDEAVQYLTYQGTILHYSDTSLQSVYFLDPQWLTKVMAAVIGPPKKEEDGKLIQDGVVNIRQLLESRGSHIPDLFREHCVVLLAKFGVVLQIDPQRIMIPSVLSDNPPLSGLELIGSPRFTTLRRYWFGNYLSRGFWPRLICRLVADKLLREELSKLTPDVELDTSEGVLLPWKPWRAGIVWVVNERVLLEVKEVKNEETLTNPDGSDRPVLAGKVRVEFHLYVSECERIRGVVPEDDQDRKPLLCSASKVLVMFIHHLESLVEEWYPGIFNPNSKNMAIPSYAPCWMCVEGIPLTAIKKLYGQEEVVSFGGRPVFCFTTSKCFAAIENHKDSLECPLHEQPLLVDHIMPDLNFCDLYDDVLSHLPVKIDYSKDPLGFGGFGFVLPGSWGELKVAFKFFLEHAEQRKNNFDVEQLLKDVDRHNQYQKVYEAVRKEVSFLAKLKHNHLTKLVGVATSPRVCMVLELAPKGSLRDILKEYNKSGNPLLPLTMKMCAEQIASGLQYLHDNNIAHLDLKSGNVLVWKFPSPNVSYRERVRIAGEVAIKLADYGISKISTYYGARLKGFRGTPGYAAPELVQCKGQEVDVRKGDVFSFGMTLSELMTFSPPFQNNREQMDVAGIQSALWRGDRPSFSVKVIRSTSLLLQRLMVQCWDANPLYRPNMKEILHQIKREEFHCLRTEVGIKGLTATSTACVFRVEPDNPPFIPPTPPQSLNHSNASTLSGSHLKPNISFNKQASIRSRPEEKRTRVTFTPVKGPTTENLPLQDCDSQPVCSEDLTSAMEYSTFRKPHTQVWVCGREFDLPSLSDTEDRKGTYTILTFYDGELGYSLYNGSTKEHAEVTAMCYTNEHVWIGSSVGDVTVVNVFDHQTKFQSNLESWSTAFDQGVPYTTQKEEPNKGARSTVGRILDMIAIPEKSCVLISTQRAKVWCCHDNVDTEELTVSHVLDIEGNSPIDCMCKVVLPDGRMEVWGTCGLSRLVVFDYDSNNTNGILWKPTYLECTFPEGLNLFCQYIVCAHFVDSDGVIWDRVWVSTNRRSKLVCWDAQERKQVLNKEVRKDLEGGSGSSPIVVRSMLASGCELLIGTSIGVVGVYHAVSGDLIKKLTLHQGPVRSLLEIPLQSAPSICAEVTQQDAEPESLQNSSSTLVSLNTVNGQRSTGANSAQSRSICPLVMSIGNGNVDTNPQDPVSPYNAYTLSLVQSPKKSSLKNRDIFLQLWNRY